MRVLPQAFRLFRTLSSRVMSSLQPVVISGPSGSGKSTLLQKMFKEFPGCFEFSVSHTTRKPREGETEGKDYYFVDRDLFEKMVSEGGFLEHAQFSGNCYGTSKMAVEKVQSSGKICILDVEINGVKNIKNSHLNAKYIFVQPPDMEVLEKRLRGRGTETEESLKKRLATVQEALDYAKEPGSYDHIIVNDDLEVAYEKLKGILSMVYFLHAYYVPCSYYHLFFIEGFGDFTSEWKLVDIHQIQSDLYKKGR